MWVSKTKLIPEALLLPDESVSENDPASQPETCVSLLSPEGGLIYIEHLDAEAKSVSCPNTKTPHLVGKHTGDRRAVIFRPRCKLWSCSSCAEINRKLWVFRAINGTRVMLDQGADVAATTLTSHEKLGKRASRAIWPKAWDKLGQRMRRKAQPGKVQYLAVPEQHKDGRMHVHMLVSVKYGKKWWKDNARSCGLGYQADEQEVKTLGIGGYVGKYLGKTIGSVDWPKNARRVRTSQGWPPLPDLSEAEGWTFELIKRRVSLADMAGLLVEGGYTVTMTDHETAWDIVNRELPV